MKHFLKLTYNVFRYEWKDMVTAFLVGGTFTSLFPPYSLGHTISGLIGAAIGSVGTSIWFEHKRYKETGTY